MTYLSSHRKSKIEAERRLAYMVVLGVLVLSLYLFAL